MDRKENRWLLYIYIIIIALFSAFFLFLFLFLFLDNFIPISHREAISTVLNEIDSNCFTSLFPPEDIVYIRSETGIIEFPHGILKQTVYLCNKSKDKTYSFFLLVHPSLFFTIYPSYGNIKPHDSISIDITFKPSTSCLFCLSKRIEGYIRVKSSEGFSLQKLLLHGDNIPYLYV